MDQVTWHVTFMDFSMLIQSKFYTFFGSLKCNLESSKEQRHFASIYNNFEQFLRIGNLPGFHIYFDNIDVALEVCCKSFFAIMHSIRMPHPDEAIVW